MEIIEPNEVESRGRACTCYQYYDNCCFPVHISSSVLAHYSLWVSSISIINYHSLSRLHVLCGTVYLITLM